MANPLRLIIEREYYERVKRKSFIITTIVVPILMLGLMMAPALFMTLSGTQEREILVVDNSGEIASRLKGNEEIKYVNSNQPADSLRKDEANEAILVIGANAIEDPQHGITMLTRNSLSMITKEYIEGELKDAIEQVRLERYNIPDINEILSKVEADVSMSTIRIDKDEDQETSSEFSYILSLCLDMLLYMFIIIYGQQVMTSIIEEKNNRVLEIMVSSVKPFYLMMGKIVGIGLVAVTQILIWGVLLSVGSSVAAVMVDPASMGTDIPAEMSGAIGQMTDIWFIITMFVYVLLFFIGGFLFYSSIYAAIGSAVSNVQDASQLSTIATMPVIIGIVASMAIINDPESGLAFWVSMIPFTSPMAMMARLPFGVATWEVLLSLALLYVSFVFMIWLCGKIYRIGIFMYGKKPTLIEIIKWARVK